MPHVAETVFPRRHRLGAAGIAAESGGEIPDGVHDSTADIEGPKVLARPDDRLDRGKVCGGHIPYMHEVATLCAVLEDAGCLTTFEG